MFFRLLCAFGFSSLFNIDTAASVCEGITIPMAEGPDPIEKGVEELGEEITCAVCHEHYLDPKILPCCHYYCNECVRALADRGNPFACPQCRKPAQLPANRDPAVLPTAYFVNRIKDIHGKMEKAHGRVAARCKMCSEGKAEAFCRQCTEFICSDCARSHEKMKTKFTGHAQGGESGGVAGGRD